MLVLDSDLLTILLRGPASERTRLMDWIEASGDDVVVTIVTFEEQMRGWLAVIAKARTPQQQVAAYARLHALLRDYQRLAVLDLNDAAAQEFALLRRRHRRSGAADLKIAAIAITAGRNSCLATCAISASLRDLPSRIHWRDESFLGRQGVTSCSLRLRSCVLLLARLLFPTLIPA